MKRIPREQVKYRQQEILDRIKKRLSQPELKVIQGGKKGAEKK